MLPATVIAENIMTENCISEHKRNDIYLQIIFYVNLFGYKIRFIKNAGLSDMNIFLHHESLYVVPTCIYLYSLGGAGGARPPLFAPNSLKSPPNWPKQS